MKFLGIDVGTGGTRAVLIDARGSVVATGTEPHAPFSSPEIGWAEQDPEDWVRAAVSAVRKVVFKSDVKPDEIVTIGLSGQMHGTVFLDNSKNILAPAIIWCDQRTEDECAQLTADIRAARLIELVSNPALPNFSLPKMLWLRQNLPDVWDKVRTILLPKDYLRFRMTGELATDVADASGTLLLDVRRRQWSSELLNKVDIDLQLLPEVFESSEITGVISHNFAEQTGLKAGTPVVAGAGDNAAGALGMGITKPGAVSVTIGTSGVVFAVTDSPRIDEKGRIHTFCHAIPERWHNTGVTQSAGLSLKWFRENFASGESFDELAVLAGEIAPGSDGLLWTPYLMGERAPHMNPKTRASFVGLTASHSKGHLVRAIMEGVAFSLRDSIEIYRELNVPINQITLGGGGSHSRLWRQIQAEVYGQDVFIVDADEGAAFGAALLAGVGAKHWETIDEACENSIRIKETVSPDRVSIDIMERQYQVFRTIYPALNSAIRALAEIDSRVNY